LAVATDIVLVMAQVLPAMDRPELYGDGLYILITFYTALYSMVGGYLTARLAPSKPIAHALVLGVLGMLSSIIGAAVNWKQAAGHEWYPIALIIIAIPACWLGGSLYLRLKKS
jgi:surface polysaccharide O-acyltransferase-like enzyme